jgi:hypothetical protein
MGTEHCTARSDRHQPSASLVAGVLLAAACLAGACVKANPATDTSGGVGPSAATTTTINLTGPLAYTPDLKPIFDSDCTYCHSGSRPSAGYSMSTYAAVMQDVVAGNASSRLVTTTQPSGSMYRYWSGDRAGKAAMTRSWVVDYKAAQTR